MSGEEDLVRKGRRSICMREMRALFQGGRKEEGLHEIRWAEERKLV